MMKKFVAVLAVITMVCMSSLAFADVKMGGIMEIMSRDYQNLNFYKDAGADEVRTLQRIRLIADSTTGDVKAKLVIEKDFGAGVWGTTTSATGGTNGYQGNTTFGIREAWALFPVADTGIFIKGGHMNLALSHGQFFASNRYGADAWVAYKDIDTLHIGLVDIKVGEGAVGANGDDVDAYAFVVTNKMGDATVGVNITDVKMRPTKDIQNIGLHYGGKVGAIDLKAEFDMQMGADKTTATSKKYKGTLLYVNGAVAMNPVTINFTLASGSGEKGTTNDYEGFQNFIDTNGHYTLLYEYMIPTMAGAKSTGFVNTTAISAGAMFAATKNVKVGGDIWILQASEKVNVNPGSGALNAAGQTQATDAGMEIDIKVLWKLADNLNWNWTIGYFKPGAAYKQANGTGVDAATGIQGLLTLNM